MHYRHTQTSLKARLMFIPLAALVVALALPHAADPLPMIVILCAVLAFMALVIVVFTSLTVELTDDALTLSFPFGIMRREIPRTDIVRAERTRLPWYLGAGVKWEGSWSTGGASTTTYLAWPCDGVALTLRDGKGLQIGTDDPEGLLRALAAAGSRAAA